MTSPSPPFETVFHASGLVEWQSPIPGHGWAGLPVPQEGPLTEADLHLLRLAWELAPVDGVRAVVLPDHEVIGRYAEDRSLPERVLSHLPDPGRGADPDADGPTSTRSEDSGPPTGGWRLVRVDRFGDLVELFSFANREALGIRLGVLTVGDLAGLALAVDGLVRSDGRDPPGGELWAWGTLTTPGESGHAGFRLRLGGLDRSSLEARLAERATRLAADRSLLASGRRQDRRRVLDGLLGTGRGSFGA